MKIVQKAIIFLVIIVKFDKKMIEQVLFYLKVKCYNIDMKSIRYDRR